MTDCDNDRVQVLTAEGRFLMMFSEKANGKKLEKPCGITIDSNDTVYVIESGQKIISMFTTQGEFISSFGLRAQGDTAQFSRVFSLSVDRNGFIIVSQ